MVDGRPFNSLRQIRDESDITVYCSRCKHSAPLPFDALAARYGWDTPLPDPLCALIRCGHCGLKVGSSGRDRDGNTIQTIGVPWGTKGMIAKASPSEIPPGGSEAARTPTRGRCRKRIT